MTDKIKIAYTEFKNNVEMKGYSIAEANVNFMKAIK